MKRLVIIALLAGAGAIAWYQATGRPDRWRSCFRPARSLPWKPRIFRISSPTGIRPRRSLTG